MTSGGVGLAHGTRRTARLAALTVATGMLSSCVEPLPPFNEGSLYVTVATTGGDFDLDGYLLRLDDAPLSSVDVNQNVLVEGVSVGTHTVELADLADNCGATDNPRTVTIEQGTTIDVSFEVACAVTGIWILITTTGVDVPSYHVIAVDGGPALTVPSNSSALVSRLSSGTHTAVLTTLTGNCTVTGSNTVEVDLARGELAVVSFTVSCGYTTGRIAVSAATSGLELPGSEYEIRLDGSAIASVDVNATTFLEVAAGDHAVELSNIPNNCAVDGANPVTASVTAGGLTRDTAEVAFTVSCASSGSIAVRTTTSGLDRGRRDYGLVIDGNLVDSMPPTASRVIDGFLAGDHSVELTQVASNCAVAGANPITVAVTTDGMTRDTADVTFEVSCTRVWGLAFTRVATRESAQVGAIHVARPDGSDATFMAWGSEGEWSPDGTKLAFSGCAWSDYYYYYGYYYEPVCYPSGLSVASTESDVVTGLTSDGSDTDPSWRPDGSRIAFSRGGRLYLLDPDGSDQTVVPMPVGVLTARQPAWSPDGSTLAFTCELEAANLDVCTVRLDGSGFIRLTNGPQREAVPAWKPDGTSIAYTATPPGGASQIELISPSGTGQSTLALGIGALRPAWSVDGTALAFVGVECNIYSGCGAVGLFRVNADGTGLTQLTSEPDNAPAWRP